MLKSEFLIYRYSGDTIVPRRLEINSGISNNKVGRGRIIVETIVDGDPIMIGGVMVS